MDAEKASAITANTNVLTKLSKVLSPVFTYDTALNLIMSLRALTSASILEICL